VHSKITIIKKCTSFSFCGKFAECCISCCQDMRRCPLREKLSAVHLSLFCLSEMQNCLPKSCRGTVLVVWFLPLCITVFVQAKWRIKYCVTVCRYKYNKILKTFFQKVNRHFACALLTTCAHVLCCCRCCRTRTAKKLMWSCLIYFCCCP